MLQMLQMLQKTALLSRPAQASRYPFETGGCSPSRLLLGDPSWPWPHGRRRRHRTFGSRASATPRRTRGARVHRGTGNPAIRSGHFVHECTGAFAPTGRYTAPRGVRQRPNENRALHSAQGR